MNMQSKYDLRVQANSLRSSRERRRRAQGFVAACRLRQLRVRSQKRRVACLVERTVRQRKRRLRSVFLGGREGGAVQFQKQDPDDEAVSASMITGYSSKAWPFMVR